MASLLLYLSVFMVSSVLVGFGVKKSNKLFTTLGLILPMLLIGLRSYVGTDYEAYVNMFNQFSALGLSEYISYDGDNIELGFYLLIQASSWLTGDYTLMFFAATALTLIFGYAAIRRLAPGNVGLGYLLYLLIVIPHSTNIVRQSIAVSIVSFAISYIVRGGFLKYFLLVMVAALFHSSALFVLPLYALRYLYTKKRISMPVKLMIAIGATLALSISLPVFIYTGAGSVIISDYTGYIGTQTGSSILGMALSLIVLFLAIMFYAPMVKRFSSMQVMVLLILLEAAATSMGAVANVFTRFSYYFVVAKIVYLAGIPLIFNLSSKRVMTMLVVAYGLVYFIAIYYIAGFSEIFPYNNVLVKG